MEIIYNNVIIINVSHKFEINPIHIITSNSKTHDEFLEEKLIFLSEIVGILLTIKNPIINKLTRFK